MHSMLNAEKTEESSGNARSASLLPPQFRRHLACHGHTFFLSSAALRPLRVVLVAKHAPCQEWKAGWYPFLAVPRPQGGKDEVCLRRHRGLEISFIRRPPLRKCSSSSRLPAMERMEARRAVSQEYDPVKLLDMFTPEQVSCSSHPQT